MATFEAFIAANRFGMGAVPGDLEYLSQDPKGALLQQLANPVLPADLEGLPRSGDALQETAQIQMQRQALMRVGGGQAGANAMSAANVLGQRIRDIYVLEATRRTTAAVASPTPFVERLVQFWGNHFTVSIQRGEVLPVAGAFEREAIRPYVFSRFLDMLRAATQHPAMLLYLDNVHSIGPHSPFALKHRHNPNPPGLNENLARELMELHSLGVGNYSQADVTTMAKILTGWTIGNPKDPEYGTFRFDPQLHEPGRKLVLKAWFEEAGEDEGEGALRLLASHPATARHIATQLARHFIADQPPASAVERLAREYQRTDGDLGAVSRLLVQCPEAWQNPLAKVKDSNGFVVSTLRATGIVFAKPAQLLGGLDFLGQRPFFAPSPAGWPDNSESWVSPDSLIRRLQWSRNLAGMAKGIDIDAVAETTIGPVMSKDTRQAIGAQKDPGLKLAMLLGSREFQRR